MNQRSEITGEMDDDGALPRTGTAAVDHIRWRRRRSANLARQEAMSYWRNLLALHLAADECLDGGARKIIGALLHR